MQFCLTIDFVDDIVRADHPWTEGRLVAVIRELARRGIREIHWVEHFGLEDGLWDAGGYLDGLTDGRARETLARLGDPLAIVTAACRDQGLRVINVLKPSDLAFGLPYAAPPTEANWSAAKSLQLGAGADCALRWTREHPEALLQLHPSLQTGDEALRSPIRRIRLWHDDDELSAVGPLRVWTSQDNGQYHLLESPLSQRQYRQERRAPLYSHAPASARGVARTYSVIELADLDLRAPFIALELPADCPVRNSLQALIEATDADGQTVPITLGIVPRQPFGSKTADWREVGIAYDSLRGHPLRAFTAQKRSCLDQTVTTGDLRCLGFARGRARYLQALADLTHPASTDWLVQQAKRSLALGVDGLDLRLSSHHESMDWENYGYHPAIMADFRQRHGIDPVTEPVDRQAWFAQRGEWLDRSIRALSDTLHAGGGELLLHLAPGMIDPEPGHAYDNSVWPWRDWLAGAVLDRVTCKQFNYGTDAGRQVADACASLGVRRISNQKPSADREASWISHMDAAAAEAYDSFNLYELATLGQLDAHGDFRFDYPALWKRVGELAD